MLAKGLVQLTFSLGLAGTYCIMFETWKLLSSSHT